jgi:hypothetical protein
MSLDLGKTAAYTCVGENMGYIILQAKNGVTPYTYSLWNETNTTQLKSPETSSGRIVYHYGSPGSTYTVRVTDACGSSFSQQVTVANLETAKIVFSLANPVCHEEDISLTCLTLGQTTYSWTGPNGYTSTQQNPVIADASASKSGWYKVSVAPEFCGDPVEDSIYINVNPPIDLKQYENDTIYAAFCPREKILLGKAATGGSGNFTYQWERRTTSGTTYSVISGETNATFTSPSTSYIFNSTATNPTYIYFRCRITDDVCDFYVYYRTNAKPCYLPVNPDLMNMGSGNLLEKQKR